MSETNTANSGIGFGGLLTIVFITLKLTHVIGWSWWWILAPLWGPLLVFLVFCLVVGALTLVFS